MGRAGADTSPAWLRADKVLRGQASRGEGTAGTVHTFPGKAGAAHPGPSLGDGKRAQVRLQWKTSFWAKRGPGPRAEGGWVESNFYLGAGELAPLQLGQV